MGRRIALSDVDLHLRFDDLHITVEEIGYGVFYDSITRHRHGKTYYEVHLVCGGRGILETEGKEYPLKKGTLYMTGPNIEHGQITDRDELMEEYYIGFSVKRQKKSTPTKASEVLVDTVFWIGEDKCNCEELFEKLSAESLERAIGYQNNVKNLISAVLVSLIRSYTGNIPGAPPLASAPDDKRIIFIDQSFLYRYATITRKDLAMSLGLSERQLQRFLKKQYGKSFFELKKEARRNKAEELAREGYSREEAAAAVGYSDMRSFKKLME